MRPKIDINERVDRSFDIMIDHSYRLQEAFFEAIANGRNAIIIYPEDCGFSFEPVSLDISDEQ